MEMTTACWNYLSFALIVVAIFQAGKIDLLRRMLIANNRRFGVCNSFVEGTSES